MQSSSLKHVFTSLATNRGTRLLSRTTSSKIETPNNAVFSSQPGVPSLGRSRITKGDTSRPPPIGCLGRFRAVPSPSTGPLCPPARPVKVLLYCSAAHEMKPRPVSPLSRLALRRASRNKSSHSATSLTSIWLRPLTRARMLPCRVSSRIQEPVVERACSSLSGKTRRRGMEGKQGKTAHLAGVSSCRQYRKLMRTPCSAILSTASSVIDTFSVVTRMRTMRLISSAS